jgi:hypothetical protein
MLESLHKLSDAAVPVNDDDWGSERQVSAEGAIIPSEPHHTPRRSG